jgi:hypothetical protein
MADNLRVIDDFTSRLEVLAYTSKAAQHYGSSHRADHLFPHESDEEARQSAEFALAL